MNGYEQLIAALAQAGVEQEVVSKALAHPDGPRYIADLLKGLGCPQDPPPGYSTWEAVKKEYGWIDLPHVRGRLISHRYRDMHARGEKASHVRLWSVPRGVHCVTDIIVAIEMAGMIPLGPKELAEFNPGMKAVYSVGYNLVMTGHERIYRRSELVFRSGQIGQGLYCERVNLGIHGGSRVIVGV